MADVPELRIPAHLARRQVDTHGEDGKRWLATLPEQVAVLAHEWGFSLGPPFPDLSYAYVAPATLDDGSKAVLKAQTPHLESRSEIAALQAFGGRGIVRLL